MSSNRFVTLVSAGLLYLIGPASASVVDISVGFGGSKTEVTEFGQTFTPTTTGTLVGIRILVASSAHSLRASIWEFNPITNQLGNLLASGSIASSNINRNYSWAEVPFSVGAPQDKGVPLALVIEGMEQFYGPAISSRDHYLEGSYFEIAEGSPVIDLDRDLTFETLIEPVPEPATFILMAASLCPLLFRRQIRRRDAPRGHAQA